MPAAPPTPLDQREAELFAGREAELRLFEDRFDPPPAKDERRVLLFTGVGGLGKSALARRIVRKLKADHAERPAAWAAIDFAEAGATDPVQACLQIRLQLGAGLKGVRFPIFDVAFARYHQERYPGSDVRKQFAALDPSGAAARRLLRSLPDWAQDGELWKGVTEGIIGLTCELPAVGLLHQLAGRWFQLGEEWSDRRARPLLGQLDQLSPDQIAAHLPLCLGTDLQDVIAGMAHRLPLAVIGDTVEAFHRGQGFQSGIGAFHNDAWLRELIWHSPGVLFVLLGRERLDWKDHEHRRLRDWGRIVDDQRIADLTEAEARGIVERFPVPEAAIRECMVAGFAGLPFYLGLQLDLYLEYRRAGQTPSPDAFGGAPDEIVTRFLSHLDQRIERSLINLAHARRFDESLYRWLREKPHELVPNTSYSDLTRFSFVEGNEDGSRRLHQLMRDILQAQLAKRPAEQKMIHEALFDYWDARCQTDIIRLIDRGHEEALKEAAHHMAAANPKLLVRWLAKRWEPFEVTSHFGFGLQLWESLSTLNIIYGLETNQRSFVLNKVGVMRREMGDLKGARSAFEEARDVADQAQKVDELFVASTLGNLGNVLTQMGLFRDALSTQEDALEMKLRLCGPMHIETARTLENVGIARAHLEDPGGAHSALFSALEIYENTLGSTSMEVASILINIGAALRELGKPLKACKTWKRSLRIYNQNIGLDHVRAATAFGNLGIIYYELNKLTKAKELQEKALDIRERKLGPNHPDTAIALYNLSNCLERCGDTVQVRPLRKRALEILEAKLGPNHPSTRVVRGALQVTEDTG